MDARCGCTGSCTTGRLEERRWSAASAVYTNEELRYRRAGRLLPHERLTCQARLPQGQVTARVPDATRLPHVTYAT